MTPVSPMMLTRLRHALCRYALPALLGLSGPVVAGSPGHDSTAASREDMPLLSQQAERWLLSKINPAPSADISVQAGALDSRTQLSKCRQAVDIDFAPGQGIRARTTLSLHCPDTPGWRLYLPMSIRQRQAVWVARNSIANGTALQASQWQRETRDISNLPASVITDDNLAGYQTRMTVAAGAVLTEALVAGKTVIKRGQSVSVLAIHGSIVITASGEALTDAAIGERIQVRNRSSGRVIEAIVINAEQVQAAGSSAP